jgi:hypothetical protein
LNENACLTISCLQLAMAWIGVDITGGSAYLRGLLIGDADCTQF